MISIEEFITGELSVPGGDGDDLPPPCLTCVYLSYKEFSTGPGLYYYFCGYYWGDQIAPAEPPCTTTRASEAMPV